MDFKNAEMILKKIFNYVTGGDIDTFTGQKTSAKSISVVLSSDGGGVNIGDVEIVDSAGNPLIGQALMVASLPVVIASNQTALTITGAVTNTVLTAALSGTANALKNILVDGTGTTLIGQKTMAGSVPVVLPSDQTVPISGNLTTVSTVTTVTNDVGVKGLVMLDDGNNTTISANPTAIAVPAGAEIVSFQNQSINPLCNMYVGKTNGVGAAGIIVEAGLIRHNIHVTGLTNIYIHSTVLSEIAGTQFYGRV